MDAAHPFPVKIMGFYDRGVYVICPHMGMLDQYLFPWEDILL
jgi:hypothetical protein